MSEKEKTSAEALPNDPELIRALVRKMIRFAGAHGNDITTADAPEDSPTAYHYVPPTFNVDGTKNTPSRSDGKLAWFLIDPLEGADDKTEGSIEVLGEGPAMRYGKLAKLYLADGQKMYEDYYLFETDGTVSHREGQVIYDDNGEEQFIMSEPQQVDDAKLRDLSTMLDYIEPDTLPVVAS